VAAASKDEACKSSRADRSHEPCGPIPHRPASSSSLIFPSINRYTSALRGGLNDQGMIKGVAAKYKDQPLDVLINNAAAVEQTFQADMEKVGESYDKIDFDAARHDFDVNTLGPMRMAQAFMPNIMKSKQKKLVNVTSLVGSFGFGFNAPIGMNYGASKAALNMYTTKLHLALKDKGVIVALVEPILVASKPGVQSNPQAKSVESEIAKLIQEIDAMTIEKSGGKITNFSTGKIDPF